MCCKKCPLVEIVELSVRTGVFNFNDQNQALLKINECLHKQVKMNNFIINGINEHCY